MVVRVQSAKEAGVCGLGRRDRSADRAGQDRDGGEGRRGGGRGCERRRVGITGRERMGLW